jgi:hypothetical protein
MTYDATRIQPARPDDHATDHDEPARGLSLDAPGRGVRRSADMDWCTALYVASFPNPDAPPIFPYQHPDAGDSGTVDLSPRDPAGGAGISDNLCPDAHRDPGATAPHADPDPGVVVPGRPLRLTYGDGLPGSIAFAIPDPDSHLPRLHHPRAARGDLSGALWQGGSAHAGCHAAPCDVSGRALGGY